MMSDEIMIHLFGVAFTLVMSALILGINKNN
jgi:hypothetical protein